MIIDAYHFHELSISYKVLSNRLNNYLYAFLVILHAYSLSAVSFIFPFIYINSLKRSLENTMTVLNSLDLDEAQYFAGPDLVLNCLQMLLINR